MKLKRNEIYTIFKEVIFMFSFILFIASIFLFMEGSLKMSGSFMIVSFILNLNAIYNTLIEKESLNRSLNLVFKILVFISEIILFNYLLINI